MNKNVIDFPVWVIVNWESYKEKGLANTIFLEKGGPPTPLPKTLGVYTTQEYARQMYSGQHGHPFAEVEIDQESLYQILKANHQQFEEVSINLGTQYARMPPFRVDELLEAFKPGSQN
jgi:hypothetical protein